MANDKPIEPRDVTKEGSSSPKEGSSKHGDGGSKKEPSLTPQDTEAIIEGLFKRLTTLDNPRSHKVPPSIPIFGTTADAASSQANLKDAWSTILEEHLLKMKPTKQVYVGAGLPILPKCITDKIQIRSTLISTNSSPSAILGAKRIQASLRHLSNSCYFLD